MSRAVLSGLLRRKMGFQGMIITDCMEMGAVAMHYGTAAGACRAAAAGADMLCISHTSALAAETAGRIYEAVCAGELPQHMSSRANAGRRSMPRGRWQWTLPRGGGLRSASCGRV